MKNNTKEDMDFEVKITLYNHGILTYDDYMKLCVFFYKKCSVVM